MAAFLQGGVDTIILRLGRQLVDLLLFTVIKNELRPSNTLTKERRQDNEFLDRGLESHLAPIIKLATLPTSNLKNTLLGVPTGPEINVTAAWIWMRPPV